MTVTAAGFDLDAKYRVTEGGILITGVQALARVPQPSGWRPPQSAPVWVTVRRRPRVAPLVLLALLVTLVLPGAGWVLFSVLQAVLLVMLVAMLAGTFVAARFWRRARREWTRMSEDYGGYGPGHSHHPNWPGGLTRHQFGSWSP